MSYVIGSYLVIGAFYDGLNRKIPNILSATSLLCILLVAFFSKGALLPRVICAIGVYILFYFFFRIGAFGGGDGKVAALISLAMGLDAFLQIFFFSASFAIFYGLYGYRKKGYGEPIRRILSFIKLVARDGFMAPEALKIEIMEGLKIPFIPYTLAGFLIYQILKGSGVFR